jgi:hypothetical protein
MTGSALPHTSTIRNHGLRAAINEYMSKLKQNKPFDDSSMSISDSLKTSEKRIQEVRKIAFQKYLPHLFFFSLPFPFRFLFDLLCVCSVGALQFIVFDYFLFPLLF